MLLHISLITSALTALALASPHPAPAQLAQRDAPSCEKDGLVACCLYASPSFASPYCSSVLATSTVTAPAVTLSTNVTSTVFVTLTDSYTILITTTSTSVITTTGTLTITVVSTSATTTTTTTTTVNTALPTNARRDAAPSPPPCVTQGTSYPASRITFACSCLYTQPTITVTPSAAATATITLLSTSSPVVTVTVYSTTTVPLTITTTSSTTTSTTATKTTTALSTSTATEAYTLVVGPQTGQFAAYTNYYYYISEMDPGVNDVNALDSCRDSCTNDPTCQFFFLTSSPTYIGAYPVCLLSGAPYSSQYVINVPDPGSYYLGYNKVFS